MSELALNAASIPVYPPVHADTERQEKYYQMAHPNLNTIVISVFRQQRNWRAGLSEPSPLCVSSTPTTAHEPAFWLEADSWPVDAQVQTLCIESKDHVHSVNYEHVPKLSEGKRHVFSTLDPGVVPTQTPCHAMLRKSASATAPVASLTLPRPFLSS